VAKTKRKRSRDLSICFKKMDDRTFIYDDTVTEPESNAIQRTTKGYSANSFHRTSGGAPENNNDTERILLLMDKGRVWIMYRKYVVALFGWLSLLFLGVTVKSADAVDTWWIVIFLPAFFLIVSLVFLYFRDVQLRGYDYYRTITTSLGVIMTWSLLACTVAVVIFLVLWSIELDGEDIAPWVKWLILLIPFSVCFIVLIYYFVWTSVSEFCSAHVKLLEQDISSFGKKPHVDGSYNANVGQTVPLTA